MQNLGRTKFFLELPDDNFKDCLIYKYFFDRKRQLSEKELTVSKNGR
jgi:hypothetical protein